MRRGNKHRGGARPFHVLLTELGFLYINISQVLYHVQYICETLFFVGYAIARCLSTTLHPMNRERREVGYFLLNYSMICEMTSPLVKTTLSYTFIRPTLCYIQIQTTLSFTYIIPTLCYIQIQTTLSFPYITPTLCYTNIRPTLSYTFIRPKMLHLHSNYFVLHLHSTYLVLHLHNTYFVLHLHSTYLVLQFHST